MAQLKDLIVNGASRFIGDIFGNKAQLTTLDAPETAGGSTYGPGTSGQVLKTNGTSIYWGADNNSGGTVTSVRVQATSPVISSVNTAQTGTLNTTISLANGYGDTKNPYASKTANYVLAAPNGSNGVPTFRPLVIADIPGLSNAMHFIGTTSTALSDGATTSTLTPKTTGSLSKTTGFEAGDVVIDTNSSYEYVWTGSAWEALGPDSSYKILQTATSDNTGTADGTNKSTSFIYSFSQNANGELSVKTRELDTSGTWSGNAATATTASKLSNTSKVGDTNKPVYFKADGTPAAISYTIDKSVPSTAVFTDRYVNSASFAHDSTNNNIKMTLTRAGSDTATVTANIPKISKDTAGVAPKGAAVSSQSQTTKFLREDGTWATPSYTTNTNTTYTFAEGSTNGAFSVTPSGGSAQSVSIHGLNGAAYKAEDYYVKRSGDTITGNINRYYSAASTDPMITALANNKDIFLFEVGHGTQADAHSGEGANHYQLKYVGTGASPNNYLQLIASTGTNDIVALQFNENGNAVFNGITRFAIGDNDNTSNKRFIIGSTGKRYLSFGGAGIQAYNTDDSVSQLYLNYSGGVVSAGSGGFTTGNITIGGGASGTNEGKTIASSSTLYLTTLASSSIILGINSTNKIRLDTSGYFRPESDGSSQLGISGTRWAKLFVGATDSYGSSNAPIYWNDGVPEQVNLNSTANNLLNALTTGNSTPVDADYYISQYVGGGTTTITYHRRPMSALWSYINGKITDNRITTATQYGVAYYSSTTKINSTAQGAANNALMGNGAAAPKWTAVSTTLTHTAGTSSAASKLKVTVLGVASSEITLTTATTGVYGMTKLSSTSSSSAEGLAATPKLVYDSIAALDVSAQTGAASKTLTSIAETDGKITGVTYSDIAIAASQVTSGTLGTARGGTGNTSFTQWGVIYANPATKLVSTAAGTAGYPLIGAGSAAPAWYGGQVNAGTAAASWITTFNGTTASTSTTTGAVKIAGGLGVAGQVTAARVGAGGSNTSYNLYVNGTTLHNGTTYFANGTTYYINNSADAVLRNCTVYSAYALSTSAAIDSTVMNVSTRAGTSSIGSNNYTYTSIAQGSWAQIYYRTPVLKTTYETAGDTSSAVTATEYQGAYFWFRQYSLNTSTGARTSRYETFSLPTCNQNRTNNANFSILTSKNAVTVAQGGTGKTSWTAGKVIYASGTTTLAQDSAVSIDSTKHVLMGAAWNDYAEYRITKEEIEPGRCIKEVGDDTLKITTKRLERGCEIVSDTFGFAIGETEKSKTPIASSGRVLAYPYESREEFAKHIGWPVCSGPNGTVSIMTEEEEEKYPSRIIGTISAVPDYEEWGATPIKVNGRVWIRIR